SPPARASDRLESAGQGDGKDLAARAGPAERRLIESAKSGANLRYKDHAGERSRVGHLGIQPPKGIQLSRSISNHLPPDEGFPRFGARSGRNRFHQFYYGEFRSTTTRSRFRHSTESFLLKASLAVS